MFFFSIKNSSFVRPTYTYLLFYESQLFVIRNYHFVAENSTKKALNVQNRETTSNPKQPTDSKNGKPTQSTDTTKVAIKRHGSGGSGSSPDQDDFVMVPTDLTKDAAEVRKHKRDSFA